MFEPVKIGFGEFMAGYYNSLTATTPHLQEFVARGFGKCVAWAPTRMIDSAEDMLSSWQRNDTDQAPTQPTDLPVIIVAMAKDYMPTGRDYTRQVVTSDWMIMPGDVKERAFGIRAIAGDIRVQLAFFAADEPTAKSLAAQFCLYIDDIHNRNFWSKHTFAGVESLWPVQIESPDTPISNAQSQSKNITILICDLTLKAEIPLFDAPKDGEANDGKGVPGTDDPAGYPLVKIVYFDDKSLIKTKIVE